MRYSYPAIMRTDDQGHTVEIPDFNVSFISSDPDVVVRFMNGVLKMAIIGRLADGKELPKPTDFEPVYNMVDGEVSWWTIAHCDIDDDFEKIMSGLGDVARGDFVIPAFHANRPDED